MLGQKSRSFGGQQWSAGSHSEASTRPRPTHLLDLGTRSKMGSEGPQPLIACGLVSICPGVTAHILSIPCLPAPFALPPGGLGVRVGGRWTMRAELVGLQCPLQAKGCQHTSKPGW